MNKIIKFKKVTKINNKNNNEKTSGEILSLKDFMKKPARKTALSHKTKYEIVSNAIASMLLSFEEDNIDSEAIENDNELMNCLYNILMEKLYDI